MQLEDIAENARELKYLVEDIEGHEMGGSDHAC